jgi:aminopeptidase N
VTTLKAIHRSDYRPPSFWIDNVDLQFDLDPKSTVVTSRLSVRRNTDAPTGPLELDGEGLKLLRLKIDGVLVGADRYRLTDERLSMDDLPDSFTLETEVEIAPVDNLSLYGLYQSSGNYCTQCEAMGFRRITYLMDRPDVLSRYRVAIRGDREQCPVMLSNGNRIGEKELPDGRHEVVWEDPHLKPSYLFALVAGRLECHRGSFTTTTGREVALEIWVEPENIDCCEHALVSLQKSMKWDEDVFGLEYDLEIYMIVAVNDFNMGAMENKGLNIFNSKYVLASPETATDDDYLNVESVIAHEYFHNWTGNRVTCRDWFQLTLKEGLTVFRDQQFTAAQTSAAVKRIDDVVSLRIRQFPEDSGPMSHPIRPESYVSMDNFYTATVYDKGAEIIRIYHTILGEKGFRQGMDLYFQRHDGSAVTCDDFRAAMADANEVNLDLLDRWYSQPGTPQLKVETNWNDEKGTFTVTLEQSYEALSEDIPGASTRQPVPIPVRIGLLSQKGELLSATLEESDEAGSAVPTASGSLNAHVLLMEAKRAVYPLTGLSEKPYLSILQGYSAPVQLALDQTDEELAFLMAHDSDPFNRWDAGQRLSSNVILRLIEGIQDGQPRWVTPIYFPAVGRALEDATIDDAFKSLLLTLPNERILGREVIHRDPDAIHKARQYLRQNIAREYSSEMSEIYERLAKPTEYSLDQTAVNGRRLKHTLLSYLANSGDEQFVSMTIRQFESANNMTDSQSALSILANLPGNARDEPLNVFFSRWKENPLVLDKWFAIQASSIREDTLANVRNLLQHPAFDVSNPNRARSLIGAFAMNQVRFHQSSGEGYELVADVVLQIDKSNPQLAARFVSSFNGYRGFEQGRQDKMHQQLERIGAEAGLSKDVGEIVSRALKFHSA